MKLALVTDLHANREAVTAVMAHARGQGAQRYAFLGDFVGYGADPGWIIDLVRDEVARGAIAVMGNHDAAVVEGPAPTMISEAREVVEWTCSQLSPAQLDFLASLPLSVQDGEMLFVHANAWAPLAWEYIVSGVDAVRSLQATRCRYTFCGHVHLPMLYHLSSNGKAGDFAPSPGVLIPLSEQRQWLVIPGSAGQPRDGNPAACYAIFDTRLHDLTFHRVPYDHEAAGARIRAAGLPPYLAERLAHGE